MGRRSKCTPEQRGEAVLRLLRQETTGESLAREYNVAEATIYQWRKQFLEGGMQGLSGGSSARVEVERLQGEVAQRDRIIGELTVANSVLKKTAGISP